MTSLPSDIRCHDKKPIAETQRTLRHAEENVLINTSAKLRVLCVSAFRFFLKQKLIAESRRTLRCAEKNGSTNTSAKLRVLCVSAICFSHQNGNHQGVA